MRRLCSLRPRWICRDAGRIGAYAIPQGVRSAGGRRRGLPVPGRRKRAGNRARPCPEGGLPARCISPLPGIIRRRYRCKPCLLYTSCEADCALIRRLADEVFPATYRGIITPSQMEYMMEWMYGAEVLAREMCGEFAWFIASADGEPCGYLSVQHEAEDLFHLQKIYVLPRFQGIGAGEFLFRHAVEYIRSVHPAPCRMAVSYTHL